MARSEKKPGGGESKRPADSSSGEAEPYFSAEEVQHLSALQLCDLLALRMTASGADVGEIRLLRDRVAEMEEVQDEARQAVEKLSAAVEKLRAPALRLGTLIHRIGTDRGVVCVGGTDYVCNVDPALPEAVMAAGTRVLLNEAFAVTDSFG
jgi:proteasome-associated ATPase